MRTFTELPGPKGPPILGNLLQLDLKQLHRVLEKWTDEFGTLYAFRLGQRPVVVVAEPEAVQMVLRNRPKLYRRLGTIEPVFKEMGITGVFSAEGEDWKRQRRLTAHALDAGNLGQFFPTLTKVTERRRNGWSTAVETPAAVGVQREHVRDTVEVSTDPSCGYSTRRDLKQR